MKTIEIKSLGKLKLHSTFPEDWFVSEPIAVPFFDGKEFEIKFIDYSPADENFFIEAEEAIQNFLKLNSSMKFNYTNYVYQDYVDFLEATDIEPLEIKERNEIWKYVYPSDIYVKRRHRRDKDIYVDIHCECEWEEEHGLQLVFRQGLKLTKVSSIDGHLTEADAYDKPDSEDELLSKF